MLYCLRCVGVLICWTLVAAKIERGCWPNKIVPYKIVDGFSDSEVSAIKREISELHARTCVRWLDEDELGLESQQFVRFIKVEDVDCRTSSSQFGDGPYIVYVRLHDQCFQERVIMHELLHVLGFKHEHQRPDRNCYVDVHKDLQTNKEFAVVFEDPWLNRFPYDKYSVMHYQRSHRMRSKTEHWLYQPLGNLRGELTSLDVWKIKYKFCSFPHFCDAWPLVCELLEKAEKSCTLR